MSITGNRRPPPGNRRPPGTARASTWVPARHIRPGTGQAPPRRCRTCSTARTRSACDRSPPGRNWTKPKPTGLACQPGDLLTGPSWQGRRLRPARIVRDADTADLPVSPTSKKNFRLLRWKPNRPTSEITDDPAHPDPRILIPLGGVHARQGGSPLFFQVTAISASASTVRRASVNNTDAADSAERIEDPDGLLVREA